MTDTGSLKWLNARLRLSLGDYLGSYELLLDEFEAKGFSRRLAGKDPLLWSDTSEAVAMIPNALGWYDVPAEMYKVIGELDAFASEVKEAGFANVVLLGMGGSSLAPIVLSETFGAAAGYPELIVLDSTDPAAIKRIVEDIDPAKTLFIVASKSGTTVEPLSFFEYFHDIVYKVKGAGAGDNFISITDPGSYLAELSKEKGFRRVFLNRSDIGGRYSVLSYFGLVPAALLGIDLKRLFQSITRMVEASTVAGDEKENPSVQLGVALGALALKGRDKVTFIGSEGLESFGLWIEQLIAESTGKEGKGIVPITGEAVPDSKDVASTPEYGDDRVFVYSYLKSSQSERFLVDALREAGQPVIEIELDDIYELGGEFFRWEVATAAAGAALEINPFDQPNVEEAKLMAKACLEKMGSGGGSGPKAEGLPGKGFTLSFGVHTSSRLGKCSDLEAAIGGFSGLINKGFYLGILPYFDPADKMMQGPLAQIRKVVGEKCAVATQFGYGPRYLHSTGQLHKGGGGKAAFIIITHARGARSDDVEIPGKPYTFWDLEYSQAMGDMAALDLNGRAVMHIELASVKAASLKELCRLLEANL